MTELTCTYHDDYDEHLQPRGQACGRPAVRVILWPATSQWAPLCDTDHVIDADAPPHEIVPLDDPRAVAVRS